jgi:hypothetical protein
LRVPIVRTGTDLLVPLRGDLEDSSVGRIERDVTRIVADTRATGVLVASGAWQWSIRTWPG